MTNTELKQSAIYFDTLQEKLETLNSLAYVLFLAAENKDAVANDFDGVLFLLKLTCVEACQELQRLKTEVFV